MKKLVVLLLVLVSTLALFAGATKEAPSAATAGGKAAGGSFTVGMNVEVATYSSWRIRSGQEKLAISPVYEPLMRFDEKGELQPYLAKSLVADPAKLTYTVTLKDGI